WIGRSAGATVRFTVPTPAGGATELEVFTTRPDTLFGATFMVVAPEHPIVADAVPATWPAGTRPEWTGGHPTPAAAVADYRARAATRTAAERQDEGRTKTGVFTGALATNPVNGQRIPVFIADYVLMGYGTGAIMAVPGGDQRDFDFARAYQLDVVHTVQPPAEHTDGAWAGDGLIINSANDEISLNGLDVAAATAAITQWLTDQGLGEATTTYRLRDWQFSRQRYWGEPFPIVYDDAGRAHPLPEEMLPVDLPDVPDYSPRTFDPDDATS